MRKQYRRITHLVGVSTFWRSSMVMLALAAPLIAGCQRQESSSIGSIAENAAGYALGGMAAHETQRAFARHESAPRTNMGGIKADGAYGVVFPLSATLPNSRLTPGAIDSRVTQANIHKTICVPGYSKSVRPPVNYTEPLKRRLIAAYGYSDKRLRDYELDHLVSLELGGAPRNPTNLFPQPHHVIGGWGSFAKDKLENRLHILVCRGNIELAQAQHDITTDWISTYKQYVGPTPVPNHLHRY